MIKTFTKNELVRFLYKESKKKQQSEIEQALLTDNQLANEIWQLEDVMDELDRFSIEAPTKVVDSILAYSRAYPGE